MNFEVNRGTITFSPCVDKEWVAELCKQAYKVEGFHVCSRDDYHDGAVFITFCDGESCPKTDEEWYRKMRRVKNE